jgi:hypothetical protein
VPEPLAEHSKIEPFFGEGIRILRSEYWHIFTLDEFLAKFMPSDPGIGTDCYRTVVVSTRDDRLGPGTVHGRSE